MDNQNQDDPDYEPQIGKKFTFKEFSQDALEQLALAKNFDKLYKLAEKQPQFMDTYEKVKFEDIIYKIGDSVLVRIHSQYDFIVFIKKIISIKSQKNSQELPLLIVNLYCNKDKIAQQYSEYKEQFGIAELFMTEEEHGVMVNTIVQKVSVLTLEEYDQCEFKDSAYFSRAVYNTQTEEFCPEINKWGRSCFCKKLINPDLPYIFCEICQKWIHLKCAGLSDEQAKDIQLYTCAYCKGN